MIKKITKYLLYFLILVVVGISYLSFFGIETKRFNQLIKNEIIKGSDKIDIELKDVKINLNLKKFSISAKTFNPNLILEKKSIKIDKISTNFSIGSFLKKEFAIQNLSIVTKKNEIKNIIRLVRVYQNSPQLFVLNQIIKSGNLIAEINLNFDEKGKISKDYEITGKINNVRLKFFNKQIIENLNFNFEVKDKFYVLKDTKFEFNKLRFLSNKIEIIDNKKNYLIKGELKNLEGLINQELILAFIKNTNLNDLNLSTESNFSFKINKKFKFSDVNIKSKINLNKLKYTKSFLILKNYLPNYKNLFEFIDHKIEVTFKEGQFIVNGKGNIMIDDETDPIDYNVKLKNKNYEFKSKINLKNNSVIFKFLDYKKDKNKNSSLILDGIFNNKKELLLKKIIFKELDNKFVIKNLSLNKNNKINYINKLDLNFLNKNNKKNKISLSRNNNNYTISGKNFDGSILLDNLLSSDNKNDGISSILNNFSGNIDVNLDKIYIDQESYLKNLKGDIKFKKNDLTTLKLTANFNDNKKLLFNIKSNNKDEKITTLFSGQAKPLVKQYKFIKGFEEGNLNFSSIKKNNSSKSQLKIYDFKLHELPALTKILTLASLQGIADILTGEGIRFNEFEMNFSNKDNLMTISEIYAIGPAISILMSGYIESNKLISLRGTLVPATTLNKVIGSIPFLGNILVGKKTGEGVFGVSFKIKGPPKDLKTTVNPIKTLTPRFITRTLEKIKKN